MTVLRIRRTVVVMREMMMTTITGKANDDDVHDDHAAKLRMTGLLN